MMFAIVRDVNGVQEVTKGDDGSEMIFFTRKSALQHIRYSSEIEAEKDSYSIREYGFCCKCNVVLIEPFPEVIDGRIYCAECDAGEIGFTLSNN